MADKPPHNPLTVYLHVADFPDNIGIGPTPSAAFSDLAADLRRAFGHHPDAEAMIADALAQGYPLTVTAESTDAVRRTVVGLLGRVRSARVLAALRV